MARVSGMEETEALRWQETQQGRGRPPRALLSSAQWKHRAPGPALSYSLEQVAKVSWGLRSGLEFSGRQTLCYLALRPVILGFKSLQAERMDRMGGPQRAELGP